MHYDEKRPQSAAGLVGDNGHDKGSNSVANTQLVAPCYSCHHWADCGRFIWRDCVRFGAFIRECKANYLEEVRRAEAEKC